MSQADTFIQEHEMLLLQQATQESDERARYFYRAAANALGRVRRAYVAAEAANAATSPAEGKAGRSCAPGVAEDQGGAA